MNKFTYKLYGVKGSVIYTDFTEQGIKLEIEAEKISEAGDKVRDWLYQNYLKTDKIVLEKIEIIRKKY